MDVHLHSTLPLLLSHTLDQSIPFGFVIPSNGFV